MARLVAFAVVLSCLSPGLLPPVAPPVTEPAIDNQVLNPADVHMQAGPYSAPDASTHASSDWEIRKVSTNEMVWSAAAVTDPLLRVHVHLADGAFVGSYTGRTTLEFDLDYRLVVRFRNNLGEVSPDSLRLFHTSVAGPPGVPGPLPWVPFQSGYRVEVVAGGFQLPVNIAFVPNPGAQPSDPFFYVTELYGTIKVVRRNGTVTAYASNLLNYDPTAQGSFPGAGEQGLTGICVDPASGDVFAVMLQDVGSNTRNPKVVRFHSSDGGLTGSSVNTLLMTGEPQGQSHQISNCSMGPDGKLYVHNGDGFDFTTAGNLDSFRGKVLRMNLDLTAPSDNPHFSDAGASTPRKYVWAYGVRNPFGGAWRESDGAHYEVENGPSVDRMARILSNRNMGWANTDASMSTLALYNWNPAHAPVNLAFVQAGTFAGSGFPGTKFDHAFVTESGPTYGQGPQGLGKRIVEFQLATADAAPVSGPTTLIEYNGTGYSSAVGLAAGPDGLYFTDLYKDQPAGAEPPAVTGARVLRVRYIGIPPNGTGTGFEAEYFANKDLSGTGTPRVDATVDLNGGTAMPAGIPATGFSVRWRGQVLPRTTDTYTFYTLSRDGVRLWVNGTLVIDNWTDHATIENTGSISLVAGQKVDVVMEYYDNTATRTAKLSWSSPSQPKESIPQTQLFGPAAVAPASTSKGGGGGGCGALGLEGLLLAGLASALRRRGR